MEFTSECATCPRKLLQVVATDEPPAQGLRAAWGLNDYLGFSPRMNRTILEQGSGRKFCFGGVENIKTTSGQRQDRLLQDSVSRGRFPELRRHLVRAQFALVLR